MILLAFFIVLYLDLHFAFGTNLGSNSNVSGHCHLPFVTEPCAYDTRYLRCTFALNSTERNKTCDLDQLSLIFSTFDIELFMIDAYHNQILRREHVIEKLILKSTSANVNLTYTLDFFITILFIEIPVSKNKVQLIHKADAIFVFHPTNTSKNQTWLIRLLPSRASTYNISTFHRNTFSTGSTFCDEIDDDTCPSQCGKMFSCLDDERCLFTGDNRLICATKNLKKELEFVAHRQSQPNMRIFLDVLETRANYTHKIKRTQLINVVKSKEKKKPSVINKLVIVMRGGIIEAKAALFNRTDFSVQIEHSGCDGTNFLLFIDPSPEAIGRMNLINYITGRREDFGCYSNLNK